MALFTIPLSSFNITEKRKLGIKIKLKTPQPFLWINARPDNTLVFNIAGNTTPYNFTDWALGMQTTPQAV